MKSRSANVSVDSRGEERKRNRIFTSCQRETKTEKRQTNRQTETESDWETEIERQTGRQRARQRNRESVCVSVCLYCLYVCLFSKHRPGTSTGHSFHVHSVISRPLTLYVSALFYHSRYQSKWCIRGPLTLQVSPLHIFNTLDVTSGTLTLYTSPSCAFNIPDVTSLCLLTI